MSKNIALTAVKREGSGKGTARETRRNNLVPAVIYGDNKAPVTIAIESKPLTLEYLKGHLMTTLCNLNVDGDKHLVIARDIQLDPVSDKIIHADFLRVSAKTSLRVDVPVHFINHEECPGLKQGGTLTVVHHEVSLQCPANQIPEQLEIDLKGLEMGHTIKLSDLTLPKGVTPAAADAEAYTVATIAAPRVQAEEAPAEGEAAAEAPAEEAKD